MTTINTVARREKRRKAFRRSSGSSGQTTKASCTSPPTQSDAAARCAQSASCESHDDPASAAEWPESERPEANASESANAGQSSTVRSVSQARKTSALTSANPSVIATKAVPKRVPPAIGVRSPYRNLPNGSCSASSARSRKAKIPTSIAPTAPTASTR